MWLVWLVVFAATAAYLLHRRKRGHLIRRVEAQFPGPAPIPVLGNSLEFAKNSEGITKVIHNFSLKYERFFRLWIGPEPFVVCYKDKDLEIILSSNTHITKGDVYRFIIPWVGLGLLTSTGQRWKSHRRIITPTFHFKILEEFVEVFNRNGAILCDKLAQVVGKGPVDIYPFINLYALDNITETAMGVEFKAQLNTESTFVKAIKDMCRVVNMRVFKPWLMTDFLLNLTKWGAVQRNALAVLHTTTKDVISKRRKELQEKKKEMKTELVDDDMNIKTRKAFLDVLLESAEGAALSDEDIREEVDTFMFEGHDTVSSGISFALYALAINPDIQEKVYREQMDIFGDSDRPPSHRDFQDMKYLERVLKEAQRLYPSVPIIARRMHEDLPLSDGNVLPEGATAALLIPSLHLDPKVFPNPTVFDPDRFLPENMEGRNPYAYVPFSAGPRNCVGQKYAIMEMKSAVSKVVRRYKLIQSPDPEDKVRLVYELVLMSANGIKMTVESRTVTP